MEGQSLLSGQTACISIGYQEDIGPLRLLVAKPEFIGQEANPRVGARVFPKNCLSGHQPKRQFSLVRHQEKFPDRDIARVAKDAKLPDNGRERAVFHFG